MPPPPNSSERGRPQQIGANEDFLWGGPVAIGGPTNPISIVFGVIRFIEQLLGLGGPDISVLVTGVNMTWANLVVGSSFLYNAIGFLSQFLQKLIGIVWDGLRHIISDVLHGHLLQALKDIQKLIRDLHNLFAPLIKWLQQLQKIQRQYQLQAMRRMINLIQRARQVLVVFKLLHVKWAKKLDGILAGIEGRLISREIDIVRKGNQIIGWINLITDPLGVFRPAAVSASPIGVLRAAFTALRAVDAQALFPGLAQVWTAVPLGPAGPLPQVPGPTTAPRQLP